MSMIGDVQTFLARSVGWKIDIHEATFEAKLKRVCKELDSLELNTCVESLKHKENDMKVIQAFAREFSVNETYFFRDFNFFNQLQQYIIPTIIQNNTRSLSIWSVGCSSGEELYSIAIILQNLILNLDRWNLYLLGTDINPDAINKAKQGIFSKFSFRQTPERYKSYFKVLDGTFEISKEIKKMVHFKYHNIMDDPSSCLPPSGSKFDLILIKNVLIYFDAKKAKTVVNTLSQLIKDEGFLATTPAEYNKEIFNFPHYKCSQDAYIIRKNFKPLQGSVPFTKEIEPEIIEAVIENLLELVPQLKPEQAVLDQDNIVSYYCDALEMLKLGDNKSAKKALRKILYLDKNLVMSHVLLGNMLKKENQNEDALKHINNAKAELIKMNPQEMVELSGGITASDLLLMLNAIKGEKFE